MKQKFEYRNYAISPIGSNYVARSVDGDDIGLVSSDVQRLVFAIDQLWDALDDGDAPAWFNHPSIQAVDLDEPTISGHFPPIGELEPSKHILIPSIVFSASALAVAVPIAYFMHTCIIASEPEIVFTLAVCAAAMAFGTVPALVVTLVSAVMYNLAIIPPVGAFSAPTICEIVYLMINVCVAIAAPCAIKKMERPKAVALFRRASTS